MKYWFGLTCLSVTLLLSTPSARAQNRISSVYSDLAAARCRTIEVDEEVGGSVQRCAGKGGYQLLVLDDDSRQSITVIDPSGKEHPLDFWEVITGAFSSVGNKAEWRVSTLNGKLTPHALIVRVNATEDPEHPQRFRSYLAVAKITTSEICVTHKISGGARGNVAARRAADGSAKSPCLKSAGPSTLFNTHRD